METTNKIAEEIVNHFMSKGATVSIGDYKYVLSQLNKAEVKIKYDLKDKKTITINDKKYLSKEHLEKIIEDKSYISDDLGGGTAIDVEDILYSDLLT